MFIVLSEIQISLSILHFQFAQSGNPAMPDHQLRPPLPRLDSKPSQAGVPGPLSLSNGATGSIPKLCYLRTLSVQPRGGVRGWGLPGGSLLGFCGPATAASPEQLRAAVWTRVCRGRQQAPFPWPLLSSEPGGV